MRTLLMITLLLTITTYSNAYNSRPVSIDTIPDTTRVKPSTGSGASNISLISGIGSFLFRVITVKGISDGLSSGSNYFLGGVFIIGLIISLVSFISGIAGSYLKDKMLQTNLTEEEKNKAKKIKKRLNIGFIFNIIGIVITILAIFMSAAWS